MAIDLEKRVEKVTIILEKRALSKPPVVRVGLALDISGSTQDLYGRGVMQETVDRLMAVSMKFDDNAELDMWAFSDHVNSLVAATPKDYGSYVTKQILQNPRLTAKWGGTNYAPAFESIVDTYFPSTKATPIKGILSKLFGKNTANPEGSSPVMAPPAMALFVTDGEASDEAAAERVLRAAAGHPLYWQLVGVGKAKHFEFLKRMADELPNVGFVNFSSLEIADEAVYEALLSQELCSWVCSTK